MVGCIRCGLCVCCIGRLCCNLFPDGKMPAWLRSGDMKIGFLVENTATGVRGGVGVLVLCTLLGRL